MEEKLEIKKLGAHHLETLNFSHVARIKINHSSLLSLIREDG
jgi:hypothetical protein